MNKVIVGNVEFGGGKLGLIAGPCVIESREKCLQLAQSLVELAKELEIPYVFKASFDKANRTSLSSFRGPGLVAGLEILAEVKSRFNVPIVTDIHEAAQAAPAAEVADMLQIPAFLCRQTDLLVAAAKTGAAVNVKKGQFLAPEDMKHVVNKLTEAGCRKILLTERGSSFGYHNLVADMRSLPGMREFGWPVIFDATHSVQRPSAGDGKSGGDGKWAPALARAAVATGSCDGVFIETYFNPAEALSDGANAIAFADLKRLWTELSGIDKIIMQNKDA